MEENTLPKADAIILALTGKENDWEISRMVRVRGVEGARERSNARKGRKKMVLENERKR